MVLKNVYENKADLTKYSLGFYNKSKPTVETKIVMSANFCHMFYISLYFSKNNNYINWVRNNDNNSNNNNYYNNNNNNNNTFLHESF